VRVFGWRLPLPLSIALWFAVWEVVGRIGYSTILPPLSSVVGAGLTVIATPKFGRALGITAEAFGLGMGLALVVGIPAGVLMARVEGVRQVLGMWVNVFVSAPISALVPILMAVLGIGQATVVVTVFLFAVFVIILDTEVGVRQASRSLEEMARSFGARPAQLYGKVLLLSALPEILAGLRVGVIRGIKGVVIGQLLVAVVGLGELFELYSRNFLMEEFWALVVLVFLCAFALSEAIAYLERRVDYYASRR
jgi:NitT/TauT family transport system permease protein